MRGLYLRIILRGITRRFRRSAVTFAGVALAVASLVTLEAIMQGVTDSMISNSVALHHGHVRATWPDGGNARVVSAEMADALGTAWHVLPRRRAGGTLVSAKRQVSTVVYGVDPAAEAGHTVVAGKITSGAYLSEPGSMVLGRSAADALGVALGQDVEYWRKDTGALRFRVGGIYETGVERLDAQLCFVRLADLTVGDGEIAVFLPPGVDVDRAATQIRDKLPPAATVATWRQSLVGVVQLTALNSVAANVVLALALMILAFGVANTMYISVNDRMHEFGVLKAMGVTPGGIAQLATSAFCGRCHEAIFTQWSAVDNSDHLRKTCQECHMPTVRRKTVSGSFWHKLHSEVDVRRHSFAMIKPASGKGNVTVDVGISAISPQRVAGTITLVNVAAQHSLPSGEFGFRELAVVIALTDRYGVASAKRVVRFLAQKKTYLAYGKPQTVTFEFDTVPADADTLDVKLLRSAFSGVEAMLYHKTLPLRGEKPAGPGPAEAAGK